MCFVLLTCIFLYIHIESSCVEDDIKSGVIVPSDSDFFDDDSHETERPEAPHRWLVGHANPSTIAEIDDFKRKVENDASAKIQGNDGSSVVRVTEMDASKHTSLSRAVGVLLTCIVCIGLLASLIIYFCSDIAKILGVDQSTLGATLVALGAEIPDTISAVSLSRNGYTHGAISGAIGSQVINISLGIGLPAFIQCVSKKNLKINLAKEDTTSLGLLVCLVFVVLSSFMLVTIPISKILCTCQCPHYSHLNRYGALMLLLVWFSAFLAFIVFN